LFPVNGSAERPCSAVALAVLWPAALSALQAFILHLATFDADFLNSVWLAAGSSVRRAAAVTYYVPGRLADRLWTSWLLIVPIGGLVVPRLLAGSSRGFCGRIF